MMSIKEIPEAVIVTMSRGNIAKFGGIAIADRYFHRFLGGEDDHVYYWKLGNLPRFEVVHLYVTALGYVRYRFNVVEYKRVGAEGIILYKMDQPYRYRNCNFIVVTGPMCQYDQEILYKGFRGFRYCPEFH